jgi:putative transposase
MPRRRLNLVGALALAMARPTRNSLAEEVPGHKRTFFLTTRTSISRRVFQSERNALLLVDVLRSCVAAREYQVHDFVIMPDHVHLLITVDREMTIERAMQLVKGRYSYRLKQECGYLAEVWQSGYSEVRIEDERSFAKHVEYIAQNPVRARLADYPEHYPYCFKTLAQKRIQGLKPKF